MDKPKRAELYRYRELDAYECFGCGEMLEVPHVAVLKSGRAAVNVRDDPENRAIWLEMQEIKHGICGEYRDAEKLRQAQEYRRPLVWRPKEMRTVDVPHQLGSTPGMA